MESNVNHTEGDVVDDKVQDIYGTVPETTIDNKKTYELFSRVPKDMWFSIFRKIGMKNTKSLYISCKWWHDYITDHEYFNFLMDHKLMKLFHMFRNNTVFPCGKNDDGKNNQMCIYACGTKIENHLVKYILSKVSNENRAGLPDLQADFVFCEYHDRYHDTLAEKIVQNNTKIVLCDKCQLITCKWAVSRVTTTSNPTGDGRGLYLGYKTTSIRNFCDDCVTWVICSCGMKLQDSTRLFCASKDCYKMECDNWKCHKCIVAFLQCRCCGLHVCNDCLVEIDFSFRKVEKGVPTPVGSKVCKFCVQNKIKQCGKCGEKAITNLLWKCQYCTEYYHKKCFDIRTKCSLCKKGKQMPYDHVRKCGGNICENCFDMNVLKKQLTCLNCNTTFLPDTKECLLCVRGIAGHDKSRCMETRKTLCAKCID